LAISKSGSRTPVAVSEWTTVTASKPPARRRSKTCSGSWHWPGATSYVSTSRPQSRTRSRKRLLNAPLTSESARARTPLRTDASISPVADDEAT